MVENLIKFLQNIFSKSPEIITIIVASLPISELRGAIPLGILEYDFHPIKAYMLSVTGNLIPVVPLLFFLNYLTEYLSKKFRLCEKFFNWWFGRIKKRSSLIEKYEALGLALFVAIPLPVTGAWTGCAAAYIFKIKFRYAFPAIICGILTAGLVVTFTTLGIREIF
jgi:uncharacterized membrane protein